MICVIRVCHTFVFRRRKMGTPQQTPGGSARGSARGSIFGVDHKGFEPDHVHKPSGTLHCSQCKQVVSLLSLCRCVYLCACPFVRVSTFNLLFESAFSWSTTFLMRVRYLQECFA